MTDDYFSSLKDKFPYDVFKEIKKDPAGIGALATRVGLGPDQTFELLEILCGPYEDASKNYVFVDNKTTWERFFETPDGGLRVYDFKGSTSIGYSGRELPNPLKERANELKSLLETIWTEYTHIKKRKLQRDIQENPFGNFLYTFGAVRVLIERARTTGSLLEGLVLSAAMIDAQLRMAIILKSQLKNDNEDIDQDLIFQRGRKYTSEREIHRLARREGVVSDDEYKEISALYELRNRAVHRYFISDFEYAELPEVLKRYDAIYEILLTKLKNLEEKQVRLGVGMTTNVNLNPDKDTSRLISKNVLKRIDSEEPFTDVPERKLLFPKEDY